MVDGELWMVKSEKRKKPDAADKNPSPSTEHGGPKGPEPTRYGDWEIGGKCVDF